MPRIIERRPILIAGPTASGKSALALGLAQRFGGAVINADSQQVFRNWRILSARPTSEDEAKAPHFLYGHVALDAEYSVGAWHRDLTDALEDCRARALTPIITGGTGLYFKALTEGLAPIPPIPPQIRARSEAELAHLGLAGLAAELTKRDPATAATLDLANPVRVQRAWEVLEATGTGLAEWHRATPPALLPLDRVTAFALTPPRDWLQTRCDARFETMLDDGVLAEVAQVMALDVDPSLPGMKAVGAPELMAHLAGKISLDEATSAAKIATRRYAKRQLTWVRNQMFHWQMLQSHNPAENMLLATEKSAKSG
jgi:tRNA dimethylallyltransferase